MYGRATIRLSPDPTKLALVLLGVAVLFALVHLVSQYPRYGGMDFPGRYRIDRLFHTGREANIPAWYSSVQLMIAAALLGCIGLAQVRERRRWSAHWLGLAIVFVLLSIDETASLHEELGDWLARRMPDSIFAIGWFVAGAMGTVVLGAAYVRFWWALPLRTRIGVAIAATLFLGGALGVESLSSPYEAGKPYDMTSATLTALEEFLEMAGISVFIAVLFDFIARSLGGVVIEVGATARE